jgi:protein TonB
MMSATNAAPRVLGANALATDKAPLQREPAPLKQTAPKAERTQSVSRAPVRAVEKKVEKRQTTPVGQPVATGPAKSASVDAMRAALVGEREDVKNGKLIPLLITASLLVIILVVFAWYKMRVDRSEQGALQQSAEQSTSTGAELTAPSQTADSPQTSRTPQSAAGKSGSSQPTKRQTSRASKRGHRNGDGSAESAGVQKRDAASDIPINSERPHVLPSVSPVSALTAENMLDGSAPHHWTQAKLIRMEKPDYPLSAKMRHLEGLVIMRLSIGSDGKVKAVKVESGNPVFVAAATGAVREWLYEPAMMDGRTVSTELPVTVRFQLDDHP